MVTGRRGVAEALRRIEKCRREESSSLDLAELGLDEVPAQLRELRHLQALGFFRNRLTTLPDWIGDFRQLHLLVLTGNRLQSLPAQIGRLTKLRTLYLNDNPGLVLPPDLVNLIALETLEARSANLESVPDCIRQLEQIGYLDLRDNDLAALPRWLAEMPNLESLKITGNPRLSIPAEIAKSYDSAALLQYYFRVVLAGAGQPLNEFKLVLVGRGGVGKTSLVHRLVAHKFKEFTRTPGIQITDWPIEVGAETVRAHIWDFGGQEIMHGTHRFFMTERALYLILISGREGTEDHDAEYWLQMVRSFAGDVPVIVLQHKSDDYPVELNRELLRDKYGRDLVFIETDSETGRGVTALREEICNKAGNLQGLKAAWPSEWRRVKQDLPDAESNWITFDDFRTFCNKRGVTEPKDQEQLADSLHALGLMLSYQHDETLRKFGVLNPQWVTKGIYQMLNAPALKEAEGKFTLKSFSDVLSAKAYPAKLHPFLLALMRKFQLCHPLPEEGYYLIPELLTKEEPQQLDKAFVAEECLNFIYRYDAVLPEGLLPRFIVETYVYRQPGFVWRTGAVLERANCRALVRGDIQGRTVTIRITGAPTGRRELLGIIREYFERLHRSYVKLPVTELVPIPKHPEASVPYRSLLMRERAGRETIEVEIGGSVDDLAVKGLLDGVDLPGASRTATAWSEAIPVFISYSHKDSIYLDQFRAALVPYERKGELKIWADQQIDAGQPWDDEIAKNLGGAAIVVMLLSNDFLASDYTMTKEVPAALARKDGAVFPIVVRPCRFDKHDLGAIQAILPGGKAISQHDRPDDAWIEVTQHLDRVIARLKSRG